MTARLRPFADEWHRVGHLGDEALADLIEAIRIDILVDLAGHTQSNRISVLARKPAPVQATWLGYLNTTGLAAVDYRITDAYMDPPGRTEAWHSETLVRLPHHACFAPDEAAPLPGPVPLTANGHVTFGSLNQWSKVTECVRDVWARILLAVPRSRLVVVAQGGHTYGFASAILDEFEKRGVGRDRVDVRPLVPLPAFLALLQGIDVALDPFPYGGGTTTLHSLWMGVPVVALAGETAMARNAVGPLHAVGLAPLCASSTDDYVQTAVGLACDLPRLSVLRQALRGRMKASALVDALAFTSAMQEALRTMWRSYCSSR